MRKYLTIQNFHFAIATLFILVGILGFVPLSWLYGNHLLFGILAVAPIINLAFVGFGIVLAGSMYLAKQVGAHWPHRRLSQTIGASFAILAIVGFLSGDYWLNLFANSLGSDILYALIAVYFLYLGFFHFPHGASVTQSAAPIIPDLPPMTEVSVKPLDN